MSDVYLKYFGLNEPPFAITPDPAFVYLSQAHRDALAHLLHGVGQGGSGGFVQLTGEVGTGKTTMCRCLLEQLPEKTQVALILNPLVSPLEMLATICEELGIETDGISNSHKSLVDALNRYLLDKHSGGWRVVVVIDEAQNLSPEALEQVRLLTNLETSKHKLLQMVLLGQPELRDVLQRNDLRQLAQRITARYHLASLDAQETAAYVRHRMKVAGAPRSPFTKSALRTLYQRSGGVPRIINIIADRALAACYAAEALAVKPGMIQAAANEVMPGERQVKVNRLPWMIAAATAAAIVITAIALTQWPLQPENGPAMLATEPAPEGGQENAPAPAALVEEAQLTRVEATGDDSPAQDDNRAGALPSPLDSAVVDTQVEAALEEDWLASQHDQAWQGMAQLWQDRSRADAIRSACSGVSGTGYACIRERGNWSRIAKLGLPVLLELSVGEPRHLLLRGIDDSMVLVGAGDDSRWLTREVVEESWLGGYLTVWPQAPGWPNQIRQGESGQAVDIVMDMAREADLPWTGQPEFNSGFENWLFDFQRRHGLEADGIVGPVTLLHLMAPTIDSPRLVERHELTAQDS